MSEKDKHHCLVVLFVIPLLGLTAIKAGAEGEAPPTLGEVVSTATRTLVPVGELGASATVITAEDMRQRQVTDVLQVLRDVEGLNVTQTGSRGGLTELYPRGGESNYTLVLIDGVQVNLGGGGFDFSTLTSDNVERIEIIRGPQSALFGSDAMGGVVQIFTKRGKGKPTVRVSTAHGVHSENGHYTGEQKVSVSGGNDLLGYSFAYGRIDDLGILDINNDFYNNTFSGRFDLYPMETLDITVAFRGDFSHYEFPTENGGDIPDSVFPGLDPDQYQDRGDLATSGQFRFDLFPWWEHVLLIGYHRIDQDFEDPPNPLETAFDAPPGSSTESLEDRVTVDYHMNFRYPWQGDIRSTLTLGYEYDNESLDQESLSTIRFGALPFGVFTSTEDSDARRKNNAFYLQEQLTLFERLHITGGFRVDDNSRFGTAVSPRGSLAYQILETGTKIRGAAGTGIKEPTFLESFGGFGTVGNPDLDPERSFSWEVGVDQSLWAQRVQLGLTYFQNQYNDMIAFVQTPFPPPVPLPPNFFNIQAAESSGVEVQATVRPGYGLTFGANYTYLDTEVTDDGGMPSLFFAEGERLLRRPRHSAAFYINWLWEGLNVRLDGTYVGKREDILYTVQPGFFYTFDNQRLLNDDYFLLNLALSYTFVDLGRCPLEEFRIFGKFHNVTNENYMDGLGYSSPRFAFMAGLEFTF